MGVAANFAAYVSAIFGFDATDRWRRKRGIYQKARHPHSFAAIQRIYHAAAVPIHSVIAAIETIAQIFAFRDALRAPR